MTILNFLFLILFNFLLHVQSYDPIYTCRAVGDPHMYTWHNEVTGESFKHQDCLRGGYYPLIKNQFLHYKAKVSNWVIVDFELYFFDGTSTVPFCLITPNNVHVLVHDPVQCQNNAVTWNIDRYASYYAARITYNKAKFHTVIHIHIHENSIYYMNIDMFLPKSIADTSKGVCTYQDSYCLPPTRAIQFERIAEASRTQLRTITNNEAQTTCQIYADAFLSKTNRAAYQRSSAMNNTLAYVLADCEADVMFVGNFEMAKGSIDVLLIEDLTSGLTSIDTIQTAIDSGIQNGFIMADQAVEEAQARISRLFEETTEPPYPINPVTKEEVTTETIPVVPLICNIYQDVYVQTWHTKDQALPPARSCLGKATSFNLIQNDYIRYTLQTDGSIINQLTLVLSDPISTQIVCNISMTVSNIDWNLCVQNGIKPSLVQSYLHETLTVHYAKAHFTTTVTRELGVFAGRFVIQNDLIIESAVKSTGICNLLSSCTVN